MLILVWCEVSRYRFYFIVRCVVHVAVGKSQVRMADWRVTWVTLELLLWWVGSDLGWVVVLAWRRSVRAVLVLLRMGYGVHWSEAISWLHLVDLWRLRMANV